MDSDLGNVSSSEMVSNTTEDEDYATINFTPSPSYIYNTLTSENEEESILQNMTNTTTEEFVSSSNPVEKLVSPINFKDYISTSNPIDKLVSQTNYIKDYVSSSNIIKELISSSNTTDELASSNSSFQDSMFTSSFSKDLNATSSTISKLNITIADDILKEQTAYFLQLRDEPWVIPLLVLSSVNLFVIVIFEIYVLYKSCGNRQHQFLGQTLLFGLFLCSLIGYAFVLSPHWVLCAIIRVGVGFAYAIVFATLVVKCLFLLNLNKGNYINSSYQCLILFFAIGIQVTIFTQWLVYRRPEVVQFENMNVCKIEPLEKVEYLSYVMFLLLMAIILSVRTRTLRENNKEAIYIGVTVGVLVIIWVSWISVFVIFDRRYEDPAQGFGLIATTIVVLMIVFVPKAIQLSSGCGKNGSNHGSHSMIYSPSFLHLQPHAVLPSSTEGTLIKHNQSPDLKFFVMKRYEESNI